MTRTTPCNCFCWSIVASAAEPRGRNSASPGTRLPATRVLSPPGRVAQPCLTAQATEAERVTVSHRLGHACTLGKLVPRHCNTTCRQQESALPGTRV
eukprot:3661125-Rhodomonas_salina.2